MMFWVHLFQSILFSGGWIVKDSQKFYINKILISIPLIITYLIGPIGLFFIGYQNFLCQKNKSL